MKQTGHGEYPLLLDRIQSNNLSEVQKLLEEGEDPNVQCMFGWTPLHQAASTGAIEYVELLLKHGADPKYLDSRGYSSLGLVNEAVEKEDYRENSPYKEDFESCRKILSEAIWK